MGSVLKPTQALKTYIVGFTSIAFTFIIFGTKFLKLPAQFLIGSPGTLGGRFNFLLTPMGQWVGVKPAAPGVSLVQSGRFLVVQKKNYLNSGSNI